MPKYVVSATLTDPEWTNTTVLEGAVEGAVARLKEEVDGEIVVAASHQLVGALLDHDLVDELRLVVYPVLLGDGTRLFGPRAERRSFGLRTARPLGDDLALLVYERRRAG